MTSTCPLGCGNVTDDPGGGPCTGCWDKEPDNDEFRWVALIDDAINHRNRVKVAAHRQRKRDSQIVRPA